MDTRNDTDVPGSQQSNRGTTNDEKLYVTEYGLKNEKYEGIRHKFKDSRAVSNQPETLDQYTPFDACDKLESPCGVYALFFRVGNEVLSGVSGSVARKAFV